MASSPSSASTAFQFNHPACAFCKGPARPAILMFEDEDWQDVAPQMQRKQRWLHAVLNLIGLREGGLAVMILEIGAGGAVTTVRESAEQVLRSCLAGGADARLVRVNPEMPLGDADEFAPGGAQQHRVTSVMGRGLECLRKIDACLAARQRGCTQGPRADAAGAAQACS